MVGNSSTPRPTSGTRWFLHFLLLGSYPLLLGTSSSWWPVVARWLGSNPSGNEEAAESAALSGTFSEVFVSTLINLGLFVVFLILALLLSRTHWRSLPWMKEKHWGKAIGLGFLYSIGLRITIAVAMVGVILMLALAGHSPESLQDSLIPRVDKVVDVDSLQSDRAYFWLCITWISFVVAGLREELWRLGVFVAWQGLFPQSKDRPALQWIGMGIIALLFGLGHIPQGLGGVLTTTVLGMGLGSIMLFHRSIWPAVLAHGFLDATSFALIPLVADVLKELGNSPPWP